MALNNSSSDEVQSPTAKKPYQKPSFRFEEVFVVTALTCGKISATDLGCAGQHAQAS